MSISGGEELIEQGHFGSGKIQERIQEITDRWGELVALMDARDIADIDNFGGFLAWILRIFYVR